MEIKPCPFCGSENVHVQLQSFVACRTCWAEGPTRLDDSSPAERWNRVSDAVHEKETANG